MSEDVRRERDGRLSLGDDERVWTDREVRVVVERAGAVGRETGWRTGWNDCLVEVRRVVDGRGGVDDRELVRMVGDRFATGLVAVWAASLRYLSASVPDDGGRLGSGGRPNRERGNERGLKTDGVGKVGGARKRGVSAGVGGVIRDEAALAFKSRIEREIRKLTREMERWLENRTLSREEKETRKCRKCNRFADETWRFCAWDGTELV